MAALTASETAQKKIQDTISILQEQRNSALDALVNSQVDLKTLNTKYDTLYTSYQEAMSQKALLEEQLFAAHTEAAIPTGVTISESAELPTTPNENYTLTPLSATEVTPKRSKKIKNHL